MTTVEALHELRRMAQPVCWRCEGSGKIRRPHYYLSVEDSCVRALEWVPSVCPSCAGTGQPERVA